MILIERTKDAITGNHNMEDLHTMHNFPVFMGCVDHPRDMDVSAEMTWQISRDTGVLQLKKLIPLDVLYQAQHSGVIGKIWMEHHSAFAQFINQFAPSSILELGGAHGILAVKYGELDEVPWTILEPNPDPVPECNAKFIKGFFDENFIYSENFDAIIHSHVFEHIYNPADFMQKLSSFIPEGKKLIFSLPNMQAWLERNYTNCINFEHSIFLSEVYVDFLLARYGFRLRSKKYFKDDHSIFYAVERDNQVRPINLPTMLYEKNKKIYQQYIEYHENLITNINKRINKAFGPIYLFGAHVFSQFLIQMGLEVKNIICILDNDEKKQGRRLYGTDFKVESPKILANINNPTVILKAGAYNQEIKDNILLNINKNVTFLE
jgi:hypothetical protein